MLCKDNIYQSHCEMKMKFYWFSLSHCYIYAIRTKLIIGTKGKGKRDSISLLFDISCLYVQFRQAVDGVLLQFVYGAGVFLDVFQAAMTKDACHCLDVGAVVEEVDGAGVAGTVPTDVLVDAGTFHPSLHRLAATLVGGEIEDEGFLCLPFSWSANQSDEAVVERDGDPTTGRVPFGLVLFETQEFVGIVDVGIAQILHVAEAHAGVEAEDKGIAHVLFLKLIVGTDEFDNLFL